MKNRLEIAREFLRDDGVIFVQCDDNEQAYLKVLCDEIFGRENFINSISVLSSTPSGIKTTHRDKTIIKTKDYILIYAKNSKNLTLKPQYTKKQKWDTHYNSIFDKNTLTYRNLVEFMIENNVLEQKSTIDDININNKKHKKFYLKYADCIFRTSATMPEEQKEISRQHPNKIIAYKDTNNNEQYALNGNRISFLSRALKPVFIGASLENDLANLLCDFWADIDFNNTQNQGEISFTNAKKPEQLLYRIIDMTTNENDIVMDFFLGSGTTAAVAHKMNRQYIGIEQMDYIESVSVERLKKVIEGEQGGISKAINWQGGGEFIYFELAKFNQKFIDKISDAKAKDILNIYDEICEKAFLNYDADSKILKDKKDDFKEFNLAEQKEFLLNILNKNMLYVNLDDIEDENYEISQKDKELNKDFYNE